MSGVYDIAKQLMLGSTASRLDLDSTDVIKCGLVDKTTDYTAYAPTNTSMTPIVRYAGTTDQTLTGAIVTNSPTVAFDSTVDPTFTAVAVSGTKTVGGLIIYKFVTNDAGSTPICFIDGFTAVVPNGGEITVNFDKGKKQNFPL